MLVAKLIEKAHLEGAICLVDHLCLGLPKKQNSVALSTAEAEYIAAGACCAQILYMKQTLLDYGVVLDKIPLCAIMKVR